MLVYLRDRSAQTIVHAATLRQKFAKSNHFLFCEYLHTNRERNRGRQIIRQRETEKDIQRETERDRERDTHIHRATEADRQTKRKRETETETEREGKIERARQTQRKRETEMLIHFLLHIPQQIPATINSVIF